MKPVRCWFLVLLAVALSACESAVVQTPAKPADATSDPLASAAFVSRGFPDRIPTPGFVAEGVAVDRRGRVYVSMRHGAKGEVWRFTPSGDGSLLADLGTATIGGLDVTANGTLYAAMAEGPDRGVYRVDADGTAERLAGTERIVYANALAFDQKGTLYVTESYSMDSPPAYGDGGIWRVRPGAEAELWLRHPLLTGIGAVLGYPVGANGIVYHEGDFFVVNTDRSTIVRVPVRRDGGPGEPEVWTTIAEVPGSPASPFPIMGDGLALDVHGNLYVVVVSRNAVVRIDRADLSQHTLARLGAPPDGPEANAPFDTPVSLAFGTGGGEQQALFVTNLGWMSRFVPGRTWPGPGLVKVDAGAPGWPLP